MIRGALGRHDLHKVKTVPGHASCGRLNRTIARDLDVPHNIGFGTGEGMLCDTKSVRTFAGGRLSVAQPLLSVLRCLKQLREDERNQQAPRN